MRKIMVAMLCLCLVMTGCVLTGPKTTVPPAVPDLTLRPLTRCATDESGVTFFTLTYPEAILSHPDNKVGQKISDDLNNRIARWTAGATALEETARQNWEISEDQIPWYVSVEGAVTRLDDAVISLFFTYSEYCGANHSNENTFSVNYNVKTGEILELSDIFRKEYPEYALVAEINQTLAPSANELFDDYEAIVGKHFTDGDTDNWYLTETALCFHYAPYDIGPYASGTITAEIPFTELKDFLQDNYCMLHQIEKELIYERSCFCYPAGLQPKNAAA